MTNVQTEIEIQKMIDLHNSLKIGDIVYFINKHPRRPQVSFGRIIDMFTDGVCLQLYTLKENRVVEGTNINPFEPIPYNDFPEWSEWKKLPKGWNYNTLLFKVSHIPYEKGNIYFDFLYDKNKINKMIEEKLLIPVREKDYSHIEEIIDSKKGFCLHKRWTAEDYRQDTKILKYTDKEIFRTFNEAHQVIEEQEKELQRIANMTEKEWSTEQIMNTVERLYCTDKQEKAKILKFLLNLKDIEDVCVRINSGHIEWKYNKNKRWMNVEVED